MGFLAYRSAVLFVCIGFLALQPEKVSGLRSMDLALRWDKGHMSFLKSLHLVEAVAVEDLQAKLSLAPAPSMTFDPNQSNKRKVRKGSDPIHNRS
ncbi:hypothetical protein Pyn_16404 [Prunus yedoensis var. nudiflora]|uniref:CLAVATA3/ESR (CLE)-related protein 45 n=1 Tax=Prunus yedoensis var. nudiflora TaxID=2094558 RepID=A0A314YU30_PRUYE|nr:hypothetical protein Pyn_16404 [Prunus yedoensis var. nudiflora]